MKEHKALLPASWPTDQPKPLIQNWSWPSSLKYQPDKLAVSMMSVIFLKKCVDQK